MIKYLGSKRRLVPAIAELAANLGARTALDLFTGTTRVAQALKLGGARVTAVDTARYSEVFARTYVESDAATVDLEGLDAALHALGEVEPVDGYVTEVFCRQARFFTPENGSRIDAIRAAIEREHAGGPLWPILLTALIEAADRVDSTTGVQMAYLKQWAPRALRPLELRRPVLLAGSGTAIRGDAGEVVSRVGPVDIAYLDPPYNQHRYFTNYHVWETLVASDDPPHYGIACKRADARAVESRSAFDSRRTMGAALARCIEQVDARLVVLSGSDEGWLSVEQLADMASARGEVAILEFDSKRYIGAQIGVHNPAGERVGTVSHLRNTELLLVAGDAADVRRAVSPPERSSARAG